MSKLKNSRETKVLHNAVILQIEPGVSRDPKTFVSECYIGNWKSGEYAPRHGIQWIEVPNRLFGLEPCYLGYWTSQPADYNPVVEVPACACILVTGCSSLADLSRKIDRCDSLSEMGAWGTAMMWLRRAKK